jgi:hypothetical protein
MALTAKGSIGKQAKAAVINQSGVKTLESMLSSDRVDGGEWSDLLSFLVARFGVAQFSRATMRGKAGCARYLESVALAGKAKYAKAETGKAQASALALLDEINAAMASVIRLQEVAEAERIQAESVAEAERIQAESVAG